MMYGKKFYVLKPINIGMRKIYPIAQLKLHIINKTFVAITYSTVAIKVFEDDEIYYKNISLSDNDFKKLKNSFNNK